MSTIAIQTAVGSVGSKAVTKLTSSFGSMVDTGKFQYGMNSNGIFRINIGEDDDGVPYERTFMLASSDYGVKNLKRFRFVYVGVDTDYPFTVSVMGDDKVWRDYETVLSKAGLQEIRRSIGRDGFGRYWKLKITSTKRFRIDSIDSLLIIRPLGLRG